MENKGNPNHYPAGTEKGGQFAPRGLGLLGSKRPTRGQLDTLFLGNYHGEAEDFDAYCVEQIVKETGMSIPDAIKFNNALQIYFMGNDAPSLDDTLTIDKGLSQMASFNGVIYRGMHFDNESQNGLKSVLSMFSEGNIIEMNSLRSWTSSSEMCSGPQFGRIKSMHDDTVILKCNNNQSGVGVKHISDYDYEDEVLCPSTCRYRVKSVKSSYKMEGMTDLMAKTLGAKKTYIIEVEEI